MKNMIIIITYRFGTMLEGVKGRIVKPTTPLNGPSLQTLMNGESN